MDGCGTLCQYAAMTVTATDEVEVDEDVIEEVIVEDLSIDGMCGVY
jgi:mycofactocin precursor